MNVRRACRHSVTRSPCHPVTLSPCLLLAAAVAFSMGAAPAPCPAPEKANGAPQPKTVTIKATVDEPPSVTIKLCTRTARAVPRRICCDHTGGGNIDVQQPSPDTLVVTMTGVAVSAGSPCRGTVAGFDFDLSQGFVIDVADPAVKSVKLSMEGRLIGLLRSYSYCGKCSSAEVSAAHAAVSCAGAGAVVSMALPGHAAAGGENVSVNDRDGPVYEHVLPGSYTLHQAFCITASHPGTLLPCKASAAEFADGALDPLWLSYHEPFKGAAKKDFGFQVTIRVEPTAAGGKTADNDGAKDKDPAKEDEEKLPPPKTNGKKSTGEPRR